MSRIEDGYDCIIIGAGPGGLQAAIYLGRYNRKVLLIDRGGGRTAHARKIENFLTHASISGKDIIERGRMQALGFHVGIVQGTVTQVRKEKNFSVSTAAAGDIEFGPNHEDRKRHTLDLAPS